MQVNKEWVPMIDRLYNDVDIKISCILSVTLKRNTKLFVKPIKQEETI